MGMMKVMLKELGWWWRSRLANSTSGMRCPIPGVGRMAMWDACVCVDSMVAMILLLLIRLRTMN